jgi:hypothetical protein
MKHRDQIINQQLSLIEAATYLKELREMILQIAQSSTRKARCFIRR